MYSFEEKGWKYANTCVNNKSKQKNITSSCYNFELLQQMQVRALLQIIHILMAYSSSGGFHTETLLGMTDVLIELTTYITLSELGNREQFSLCLSF